MLTVSGESIIKAVFVFTYILGKADLYSEALRPFQVHWGHD